MRESGKPEARWASGFLVFYNGASKAKIVGIDKSRPPNMGISTIKIVKNRKMIAEIHNF